MTIEQAEARLMLAILEGMVSMLEPEARDLFNQAVKDIRETVARHEPFGNMALSYACLEFASSAEPKDVIR